MEIRCRWVAVMLIVILFMTFWFSAHFENWSTEDLSPEESFILDGDFDPSVDVFESLQIDIITQLGDEPYNVYSTSTASPSDNLYYTKSYETGRSESTTQDWSNWWNKIKTTGQTSWKSTTSAYNIKWPWKKADNQYETQDGVTGQSIANNDQKSLLSRILTTRKQFDFYNTDSSSTEPSTTGRRNIDYFSTESTTFSDKTAPSAAWKKNGYSTDSATGDQESDEQFDKDFPATSDYWASETSTRQDIYPSTISFRELDNNVGYAMPSGEIDSSENSLSKVQVDEGFLTMEKETQSSADIYQDTVKSETESLPYISASDGLNAQETNSENSVSDLIANSIDIDILPLINGTDVALNQEHLSEYSTIGGNDVLIQEGLSEYSTNEGNDVLNQERLSEYGTDEGNDVNQELLSEHSINGGVVALNQEPVSEISLNGDEVALNQELLLENSIKDGSSEQEYPFGSMSVSAADSSTGNQEAEIKTAEDDDEQQSLQLVCFSRKTIRAIVILVTPVSALLLLSGNFKTILSTMMTYKNQIQQRCLDLKKAGVLNYTDSKINPDATKDVYLMVSDKYKFMGCKAAKVGGTNLQRLVYALENNITDAAALPQGFARKHSVPMMLEHKTHQTERLNSYTKFMIFRDPLERIVSAFRDEKPFTFFGNTKPTFLEYLHKLVTMDTLPTVRPWREIWKLCNPCEIDYDYILPISMYTEGISAILSDLHVPSVHFPTREETNYESKSSAEVTKEFYANVPIDLQEILKRKYAIDYYIFQGHIYLHN